MNTEDPQEGWYVMAHKKCPYCNGTGRDPKKKELRYDDPRGMCFPCMGKRTVSRAIYMSELKK